MKKYLLLIVFLFFFSVVSSAQSITLTVTVVGESGNNKNPLSGVEVIIENSETDRGPTDGEGKIIFPESSPNIKPGHLIHVKINHIPSNYEYNGSTVKNLRLGDFNDNSHNVIEFVLTPIKTTFRIFGNISNSKNEPLKNIIVSVDGFGSAKSDSSGFYSLLLPARNIVAAFGNKKMIPLQYHGGSDYVSGHEDIKFEGDAVLVNKTLQSKEQPPDKVYVLSTFLESPKKYKNQEAKIELLQKNIRLKVQPTNINKLDTFQLSYIDMREPFVLEISSDDLDTQYDTVSISDLNGIRKYYLDKTIILYPFSVFLQYSIHPVGSYDSYFGGGVLFDWKESHFSFGLNVNRVRVSELLMDYPVFETTNITTDSTLKRLTGGPMARYTFGNNFVDKKNKIFADFKTGFGKDILYVSLGAGYHRLINQFIGIDLAPELIYYHVNTNNLEFNYYGDARPKDGTVDKLRVNVCIKLSYQFHKS